MSTRSLSSLSIRINVAATLENLLLGGVTKATSSVNLNYQPQLTSGVSARQANRALKHTGDLLAAGTQVIDLFDFAGIDSGAGDGKDALGQSVDIEEILLIAILVNSGDGSLEIEPDVTNPFPALGSHTVANGGALRAGGILLKTNRDEEGFDVADGSAHRILLTATGGAVNYTIFILGRNDDDESSSSSSSPSSNSSSSSLSSLSSSSSSASSNSSSSNSSSSSVP